MAETIQQKTIPTLYNLSSSQGNAILWALEEVTAINGLKYNLKNFSRRGATTAKDLKVIFPLGKSPIVTLEPVASEPDQTYQIKPNTLTESRLILQFISENYTDGIWVPESEGDKRRDVFFSELAKCTLLEKVDFALVFEVTTTFLPFGIRQLVGLMVRPIVNHFLGDLRDIFQIMEEELSEGKPWFAGSRMGLADFNMSFGMDMASARGYFDGEKYRKVQTWLEKIHAREAYKKALEKGGGYDLVNFT
jgi:glutathione S-transferase